MKSELLCMQVLGFKVGALFIKQLEPPLLSVHVFPLCTTPILKARKVRLRGVELLSQRHTTGKLQRRVPGTVPSAGHGRQRGPVGKALETCTAWGTVSPGSVALGKLPNPFCMFPWLKSQDTNSTCRIGSWDSVGRAVGCSPEVPPRYWLLHSAWFWQYR